MPHKLLADRLQAAVNLSDEDRGLLSRVQKTIRSFSDRELIAHEGDRPQHCALVVDGFAFRQKVVADTNQILAFYVPGDAPDLHTLQLPVMDHDLVSAGPATIAFISHVNIRQMMVASRSLTNAFWRETLIDAAIYREWVATLGSRDAIARIAHILCELAARLDMVGMVQDNTFQMPFTQANLADACGLSNVHINRTVQQLRHRGWISWHGKTIVLLKRKELETVAEFVPDYLHQSDGRA